MGKSSDNPPQPRRISKGYLWALDVKSEGDRIEEVCKFGLASEGTTGTPLLRTVPRSNDVLWSSFVCSGDSMENNGRSSNANMIADRDTTATAVTFHGTVDFADNGTSKYGVCENSTGIVKKFAAVNQECSSDDSESGGGGASDSGNDQGNDIESEGVPNSALAHPPYPYSAGTSTVCGSDSYYSAFHETTAIKMPLALNANMVNIYRTFHDKHMVVVHMILNNKDFLIPVKRSRVWFLWCHYVNLHIAPEDALERLHRAQAKIFAMRDILKKKRLPMEACTLSPPDHPTLMEEMDRRQAKITSKDRTSAKLLVTDGLRANIRKPTWYADMKNTFVMHGVEWIEPTRGSHASHHVGTQNLDPYRERTNIFYQALATREKFILHLIEQVYPRQGDEKRAFVISRSPLRSVRDRPTPGVWPCTMPRTKVWIEFLQRDQIGAEKLATQGFFPGEYEAGRLNQTNLADLAGNDRCSKSSREVLLREWTPLSKMKLNQNKSEQI